MKTALKKQFFTAELMHWHRSENKRSMPWKNEKDPYKIWLSEIILQQTRVEQGREYYNRFIAAYPLVEDLARADDKEVFKLWEGLGYYSRCRNLLASARRIAYDFGGKFPNSYEEILSLKGVGPYTAAAISSFAYGLPFAVTDGNVFRVLARFFGEKIAIDSTEGKKFFAGLSSELLDKKDPAAYNQAIMDFGAVICKPQVPLCPQCPLRPHCTAFNKDLIPFLPVKEKRAAKTRRYFYYVIAETDEGVFTRERSEKDIWRGLHEFILFESAEKISPVAFIESAPFRLIAGEKPNILQVSSFYTQQLTHRIVDAVFVKIKLEGSPLIAGYRVTNKKELAALPFPRLVNKYFEDRQSQINFIK